LLFRFAEFGNIELLYSTMYVVAVCVEGAKWWQFRMMERQQVHCGRGYPLSCLSPNLVGQSVSVVSSLLCFDFIDDENDFFTVYRFSLFIFAYFINLCFVGCFFWF